MKKLLFMASLFLVATTTQAQITLISQGTPAKIAQNAEVKVSITYTSTVEINEWQIQLFPANADGTVNWGGPDPGIYIGNNYTGSTPPIEGKSLPIAAEPKTLTFTSYCDGAKVPVGTDNYIWFVKLKGPGFDEVLGQQNLVSVSAVLATSNFKKLSSVFLINSNSRVLQVLDNSEVIESASIYTLEGKKVKTIQNLATHSNHDLSMFPAGLYILSTSDNRSMKFSLY